MKKVFKVVVFVFILSILIPFLFSKAFSAGECNKVTAISIDPTTGSTKTSFTITGHIDNCANQNGPSLRLFAENPNGSDSKHPPFSYQIRTTSSGDFTVTGVFPEAGTWDIKVIVDLSEVPMDKSLTVSITATTAPKQCGDIVPPHSLDCPPACPSTQVSGDVWKCGGARSDLDPRCNTSITIDGIPACTQGFFLAYVRRCGTGNKGFVCDNLDARLCMNGEKNEENVVCQTPPPPGMPGCPPGRPIDQCTIHTAIGDINVTVVQFGKVVFAVLLSLAGGIALLLIIYSGYRILTSQGNPEHLQGARETLTSAIVGLLFIIFSIVILQIIGVNILQLPGFSP